MPTTTSHSSGAALRTEADELRARYRAYRRRQARRLLGLIPREAVRPLYRRARRDQTLATSVGEASLEALVGLCETLLPLPPFEVWLEDVTLHPLPHLYDLDDSAEAPTARTPVTMDARLFVYRDEPWIAHLRAFRDGITWRGYIAFEHRRSRSVHRTSIIFREPDPVELCARFSGFDNDALEAFLRSSLT